MAFLTKKCSVRKLCCSIVLLILIAVAAGLILWQYLPEEDKETLTAITNNGIPALPTGGRLGDAPPPTYQFIQCDDMSNCCNGLANTCDMKVHEILYAGLHNAQASLEDGFLVAPNHEFNLIAALEYGYRVLNLDIGVCAEGEIVLVHGICRLGTADPTAFFTRVHQWLSDHPTEVIIIPMEINNNAGGGEVDLGKLYNLLNRIDGFVDRLYVKVDGEDWPTLRDMVQADTRVLLFHYNGDVCASPGVTCPPGFNDWFRYAAETKFEFGTAEDFDDKADACAITRGRPEAPFYALNLFVEIPSKYLASTKLNTQAFLEEHIAACAEVSQRPVSMLFLDYWSEGQVPQVVQAYNSLLQPTNSTTRK